MTENTKTNSATRQEKLAKGVAWLTAGDFISRLLGIAYIIPWFMWLGSHRAEANALFSMGYQIYAIFLLISTVGLPAAVSKQVAKYNVLGREDTSYYLVKEFLKLMLLVGAVCAGIMYLSSGLLAELSGSREKLIPVMYSLVPSLFVFPVMSTIRGLFQGHHNMMPTAVSQVIEQVVRVIWILTSTFYIMKLGSGDYLQAVVYSTFGAFVGMLASMGILVYLLYKEGLLQKIFRPKPASVTIDIQSLIIETAKEAVPLIVMGSAFQLFQTVDQLTFIKTLEKITDYSNSELLGLYTYMLANPSKITMLIVAIAGSIGSVALLLITEHFVKKDWKGTAELLVNNIQMLLMLIIPAMTGTLLLARPIYTVFYGPAEPIAIYLFIANIYLIFFQGLYMVYNVMIQALFENRKAILYFFIGFGIKIVLQIPFLYLFQAYGALLSTAVGMGVSIVLFARRIQQVVPINYNKVAKDFMTIGGVSLIMAVFVILSELLLNRVTPATGYVSSAVHVGISGVLGVAVFVLLTLKTRQLDRLLGARAVALRKKLHIS
ncbi:putative polysaccharide biosynthesis protein [Streptococcus marmotae]|uniref:putative polysaccharide biosynthesis protein n=1 Tax=Streptococcus marmotae TaxID=1825069 RepID=UPI0008312725|nr:polysaccharide biosynthesis protein [Streptococcus marmotae]